MIARSFRASAVSIAFAATLWAYANGARAAGGTRIAVAPVESRGALTLRLAAELAEMGYVVVPISADDAADGAVLARALVHEDAVAALVIENDSGETLACVVERQDVRRTCRDVAGKNEKVEDAAIATRAAELLRALVPAEPLASKSPEKMGAASTSTTEAVVETSSHEEEPSEPADAGFEARFGPGVMLANGAPAELALGAGGDWIVASHFALGLDAMVPLAAGTIDRWQGSASVRSTSIAARADARYATGHWETAVGAGVGLLWLQVTGTSLLASQAIDDSFVDPFAMLHAELSAFVSRAAAVRLDVMGGYGLNRAPIVFSGQDVAEIGRPLAMSTLSLAITWQ